MKKFATMEEVSLKMLEEQVTELNKIDRNPKQDGVDNYYLEVGSCGGVCVKSTRKEYFILCLYMTKMDLHIRLGCYIKGLNEWNEVQDIKRK